MKLNIEIIKKYRFRAGLSQDEVSKITRIDISLLESGFTDGIKLSQLNKLAKLYNCDNLDFYKDEILPEIKTHICYESDINEEI